MANRRSIGLEPGTLVWGVAWDVLRFETTFPSAGRYRAFLQFSAGGRVRTAEFTLEVPR